MFTESDSISDNLLTRAMLLAKTVTVYFMLFLVIIKLLLY